MHPLSSRAPPSIPSVQNGRPDKQQKQGKPHDKPNLVMGSNAQICWKKAMRYFEVEARFAPVSPDCLVLTAERCVRAFVCCVFLDGVC